MKQKNLIRKIVAIAMIASMICAFTVTTFAWQVGRDSQVVSSDCSDVTGTLYLYADTEEGHTDAEFAMSVRDVCEHYPLNVSDEKCKLTLTYKVSYPYTYTTGMLWWKEEHTVIRTDSREIINPLAEYPNTYRYFNTDIGRAYADNNETLKESSINVYAYIGSRDLSGFRFDMTVSGNYSE